LYRAKIAIIEGFWKMSFQQEIHNCNDQLATFNEQLKMYK